jgi:plasmid stability protein
MTSVQIKGVPEGTHAVLRQRAARAHQSLQEYLLGVLVREANSPTLDEVLDRADNRTGGTLSFSQAVQALRDDRDRR